MKPKAKIILNTPGVAEGAWIDGGRFNIPFSIAVYNFALGDTVEIITSNQPGKPVLQPPQPGDGQIIEGWPTIAADGRYPVDSACRWVRVRKATAGITAAWQGNYAYGVDDLIVDSNGNLEQVSQAGTSGAKQPTWSPVKGHTTSDGTAVWTNLGSYTGPAITCAALYALKMD